MYIFQYWSIGLSLDVMFSLFHFTEIEKIKN